MHCSIKLIFITSIPLLHMQGYVAALFFLVTGGMTLFSNISTFIVLSASSARNTTAAYVIQSIQFVSCVIMMGCYVSFDILGFWKCKFI